MITLQNVSFSYGDKHILRDFSLHLEKGEILAVMGESGCGKSTLLNIIAGLRAPNAGTILSTAQKTTVVFQEPRLLPWMTVFQNIHAVLPKGFENAEATIAAALETVGLSDSANLYPRELSGGMKSRASLARALAFGGDLFLLDEPFSALDEDMSRTLATTLRDQFKQNGISAILVTHRHSDAEAMADRTVVLS